MKKEIILNDKDMIVTIGTVSQKHIVANVMFSQSMNEIFGEKILRQIMDISDKYVHDVKNIIEEAINSDEDILERYVKKAIKETSREHIKKALDVAEGEDKEYIVDVIKEMAADEDKDKKSIAKSILKDIKKGMQD